MAVTTTGLVVAAGSAAYGSRQARNAAGAQGRAAAEAQAQQAAQYEQSRRDLQPWREVGTAALNQLAALYGLPQSGGVMNPDGTQQQQAAPDFSSFINSPDYQFAREEGLRGIQRSAAARGGLASGNTLARLNQFNSGLASQQFGNYTNRLASIAGAGQQASQGQAQLSENFGANSAQNSLYAGNARASGITNSANQWMNFGQQLGGAIGYGFKDPTRATAA